MFFFNFVFGKNCGFASDFATDSAYLAFKISDARFARKTLYKRFNAAFGEFYVKIFKPVFFNFRGNEIALGNLDFFFLGIAAYLYNLHTVEKRRGNGIERVRRGNEQHFRQVVRNFQISVAESGVLLGV